MCEQFISLFTLHVYWLSNLCTETSLFNESNFLWTLTKCISLAHHWRADAVFWNQLAQYRFFTFTHSLIQLSSTGREWLISLMPLYNTPQVKHRNIWGHLWCEEEDWGSWKCQKHLIPVPDGPAVLDAEFACECASPSTRGANHLRNQITVSICSWGNFLLRLKKNLHMGAVLHQTRCDTTGANLPILVPHILIHEHTAFSDACERLTLREK